VRRLLAPVLLLLVLLLPAEARAGGWWSFLQLDRALVAPGQDVRIRTTSVLFPSREAADQARDMRFYVYLLRGFDHAVIAKAMRKADPGDWWALGDAEAVRAGRVQLTVPRGSNVGRVQGRFQMPEVPAGRYALMVCDAGCVQPLADLIPAERFRVLADVFSVSLAARVKRLERQAAWSRAELAELRTVDHQAVVTERTLQPAAWVYAGWVFAGSLLGGLGILLLLGKRRARRAASLDDAIAALLAEQWEPPRPRARAG
jgi:hypothetical protein